MLGMGGENVFMKREKMMRTALLTDIFLILLFWSTGVALADEWHELQPTIPKKSL
jgi:hypothetical protein